MRILQYLCVIALAVLMLGAGNAIFYGICDEARITTDKTLECKITEPKHNFTQESIDVFWESVEGDQNYLLGEIENVHWIINGTVVRVIEDVHFVETSRVDMPWDLTLRGDANTQYEINRDQNKWMQTEGTHTAITTPSIGLIEPVIHFSPLGGRRTIRNLVLENPGGFATHISGNVVKPMEIDIEGHLSLTESFMENIGLLKAKGIYLNELSYLKNVGKIEAENLSLATRCKIDSIGELGKIAIELKNSATGLQLSTDSSIENLLGSISVDGDISLSIDSSIKTTSPQAEEVIQGIDAKNMSLSGTSEIMGVGGSPGAIVLQGSLSLDQNSSIAGRKGNSIKKIEAGNLSLANGSWLWNIEEILKVTGDSQFRMTSGAQILSLQGSIESCAPIAMSGSNTKIMFTEAGERELRAPGLDLNDDAKIVCLGRMTCDYNFVRHECGSDPVAELGISGNIQGDAPFAVLFTGSCSDKEGLVSCKIDFGDGTGEEEFIGTAVHIYNYVGTYTATLTAVDSHENVAKATKVVNVTGQSVLPPPPDQNQGRADLEIRVFPQTVEQGEILFVQIDSDSRIESFSLENDAGLEEITTAPEHLPARVGPFRVSKTTKPGTYYFMVRATVRGGREFEERVSFTVEEKPVSFSVESFLPMALIFVVVLAVIAVLTWKLSKEGKLRIRKKKEGEGEERKGEEEKKEEKKKPEERAVEEMKEKNPMADIMPLEEMKENELPPWLKEEKGKKQEEM